MQDCYTPSFSVIIPVFNGDKVIGNCLNSIVNQSFTDFEVIIIDDGSKDETGNICKQLASTDKRIKYYKQENGGVSSARNKGLQLALSEYILFVDADDSILLDYIHRFHQLIDSGKIGTSTFVIQNYLACIKFKDGKEDNVKWCRFPYLNYTLKESFENLDINNWLFWGVPFSKLYRLSIIKSNNLSFHQEIQGREDLVFMLEYMKHIDVIIFDPVANYKYTVDQTKDSVSSVVTSFKNEYIFFTSIKQQLDYFIDRFKLNHKIKMLLYNFVYTSFSKCINSSLYKYQLPMARKKRLENIRLISSSENIKNSFNSGVVNTKVKYIGFTLLRMRFFNMYDLINQVKRN